MKKIDIYVINLKERTDRLDAINKLFKPFSTINIHPVEAVTHTNGTIGCFLSHKKCLQFAKNNNLTKIIVIEDDCQPLSNFESRLHNILSYLETNDNWDIFLGGGFDINPYKNKITKIETSLDNLFITNSGVCFHFIIYNHTCFDFFLNYDETLYPIDNIWQNNLTCIIPIPFIATQSIGFSNISNSTQIKFYRKIRSNNDLLVNYIDQKLNNSR